MTHSYPKVTYNYPRVTYSDPKVTHSDPKVTQSDPTHLHLPPLASPGPRGELRLPGGGGLSLADPCLTLA